MKKQRGYWENEKNIKHRLGEIIDYLGYFPTKTELEKIDSGLVHGIQRHHGGLLNVKQELGYKSRKPPKYLKNKENVRKEVERLIQTYGHFPNYNEFKESGNGSLIQAIWENYGGLSKLKKEMGYKYRLSKNDLEKWENIEFELKNIIKELGHFPSYSELRKLGRNSLENAIMRYHDGLSKCRKKMGYEFLKLPNGSLKDIEFVKEKMDSVIRQLGHYPTSSDLRDLGYSSLDAAIYKYHGGYEEFRKLMGYYSLESADNFINFVESNQNLKEVVRILGDDQVALAHIVSIMYGDRLQRRDLAKFLYENRPLLKDYMGIFVKGIKSIQDVEELAENTLPFDKDNKIKNILVKIGTETALRELGPKPSNSEIENKLKELELRLNNLN